MKKTILIGCGVIATLMLIGFFTTAQNAPDSAPVSGSSPASAGVPSSSPALSAPSPALDPNSPIEFTEVVQVEGATASELYTRGKVWFAKAFVSSNHVLEVQDKEAGLLVGKGTIEYEPAALIASLATRGHIGFTVKIMVKDGRYKYSIGEFKHSGSPFVSQWGKGSPLDFGIITNSRAAPDVHGMTDGSRLKDWNQMKDIAKTTGEELVKTLRDGMTQASKGADNW